MQGSSQFRIKQLEKKNSELIKKLNAKRNDPNAVQGFSNREDQIKNTGKIDKDFSDNLNNGLPAIFFLYEVNASDKLIRWNKNFETVTGYTADERYGMRSLEFFNKEDHELIKNSAKRIFAEGEITIEANVKIKSVETISYFFKATSFNNAGKDYLFGVGLDISDKKKSERELWESKER